jgi:hypothetical protein
MFRALAVIALGLVASLAGCSSTSEDPDKPPAVVQVPWERPEEGASPTDLDQSVTLAKGQTATVDFGDTSSSIGDNWELQDGHDGAIVEAGPVKAVYEEKDPPPGSFAQSSSVVKAVDVGTTTLTYQYSYRGTELITYRLKVTVD